MAKLILDDGTQHELSWCKVYTTEHGNIRAAFPGNGIDRRMLSIMDEGQFKLITDNGETIQGKPVEYWDPDELDVIEFVVKPRPFKAPEGVDFIEYLKRRYNYSD